MGFNLQDKTKITVKDVTFENNDDYVDFHIQRNGKEEDCMKMHLMVYFHQCWICVFMSAIFLSIFKVIIKKNRKIVDGFYDKITIS